MAFYPCMGSTGENIPVVAPDFSTTLTYNKEDVVLYNGTTYMCNTDGTTGTWNSTYWDQVYLSDLSGSSYGGEPPVLLWTNPDPTSDFAAQTVSLDLSEYSGVIVEYISNKSNQSMTGRSYFKKSDSLGTTNLPLSLGTYVIEGGSYIGCGRAITKLDDTGIGFSIGRYNGTTSNNYTYNNRIIPTKIYGVKSIVVETTPKDAPVLLWTNASPTASFAAQTVALDLSDYTKIIIEFMKENATQTIQSRILVDTNNGASSAGWSVSSKSKTRAFTVTSTGVTFETVYQNGTSTTGANDACIPYKIYGVKKVVVEVEDANNWCSINAVRRYSVGSYYPELMVINNSGKAIYLCYASYVPAGTHSNGLVECTTAGGEVSSFTLKFLVAGTLRSKECNSESDYYGNPSYDTEVHKSAGDTMTIDNSSRWMGLFIKD